MERPACPRLSYAESFAYDASATRSPQPTTAHAYGAKHLWQVVTILIGGDMYV
jgi:hypothetical protein